MTQPARVVDSGPGWRQIERTGHWRELVGWVARLDEQGRLLEPATHQPGTGNQVTVRVRVRVPEQPRPTRQPAPAHSPTQLPPRRQVRWELRITPQTIVALVLAAAVGAGLLWIGWLVVRGMASAAHWVSGHGPLVAALAGIAAMAGLVLIVRGRGSRTRGGACSGLHMHCSGCRGS